MREIDLNSKKLSKEFGLTGPQLLIMHAIAEAASLTPGELARAVSLSQATVTSVLDRLEARHYLQRIRSTTDKRKVLVSLSEEGREVLARAPSLLQAEFVDAFQNLPEWEQHMLVAAFERVAALMNVGEWEAAPMLHHGPVEAEPPTENREEA